MGRLWAAQELLRSLGQLGGALEICRSTGGLCELWSSWGALQLLRNSEVFGAPGELWSFGAAAELAGLFSWWLRHHLCLPKASGTRTHTHTHTFHHKSAPDGQGERLWIEHEDVLGIDRRGI